MSEEKTKKAKEYTLDPKEKKDLDNENLQLKAYREFFKTDMREILEDVLSVRDEQQRILSEISEQAWPIRIHGRNVYLGLLGGVLFLVMLTVFVGFEIIHYLINHL